MIMLGKNIQSVADKLQKVSVDELCRGISRPQPTFEQLIRQLRVAYQIDAKQYSLLKRSLPYIVCGIFNPPYRKTENFGYTEYFIVDIDHLTSKGFAADDLRQKLQADSRVRLCFLSPSEDGLKIMFKLSERCYDAGLYSLFYKEFLKRFSMQYGLEQVADVRTSDVTRACFLSVDANAYINKDSESVCINEYINTESPIELFDLKMKQEKAERQHCNSAAEQEVVAHDPEKDVIERIKMQLNPQRQEVKKQVEAYVPQRLVEIMDGLKGYIEETGLVVSETIGIQYGQKLRIKMGGKEAEINIFFGKKGFSVVKSPRCGTNTELNDACADLIQHYIDTQC